MFSKVIYLCLVLTSCISCGADTIDFLPNIFPVDADRLFGFRTNQISIQIEDGEEEIYQLKGIAMSCRNAPTRRIISYFERKLEGDLTIVFRLPNTIDKHTRSISYLFFERMVLGDGREFSSFYQNSGYPKQHFFRKINATQSELFLDKPDFKAVTGMWHVSRRHTEYSYVLIPLKMRILLDWEMLEQNCL